MKYYQVAVSSKGYQTGRCVCKIQICSAGSCFPRFYQIVVATVVGA
jgi:hypothetical protein